MNLSVVKITLLASLLLVASKQVIAQETGFPFIRNYSPKEYKGDPQVWTVLQDRNTDILYFGGLGIINYDGSSWNEITLPNKTYVYSLAQDQQGKIYVGAIDDFGYLTSDSSGKPIFKSLTYLVPDSTLKIGTVWSINVTDNEIFFHSEETVFQYLPNENKINLFHSNGQGSFRGDFVHKNNYYVRLSEKGLVKIENGVMSPAPQSDFFKTRNAFYKGVMPFSSSKFLIATRRDGLVLYDAAKDTIPKIFKIQDSDFLSDNDIYTAFLSNEGFAIGSGKKGLLLFDRNGKSLQHYNQENLLQTNGVYDIYLDKNKNIWLGLENGISKTEHSPDLSYWDKHNGLKGAVTNIIRFQNRLYITTYQNVYYLDSKNVPREIKDIPVGQSWGFKTVKDAGREDVLLVGTHNGIYEINGTTAKQLYKGEHAFLLHQSQTNPNRIISVDGYYFISLINKNGTWIPEGKWEGISEYALGIVEDATGELWIGTLNNGVLRVTPDPNNSTKPKAIRYYTAADGLPKKVSTRPFWFKDKIVWGTEKGLYVHSANTNKFEPFCEFGNQFCDGSRGVAYLEEVDNGRIYISPTSNKKEHVGYLLPNKSGGYDWVYQPFCRLPEIASIVESGGMYVEKSGVVWIVGNEGLFRYDESKDTKNYKQSFKCLIREVKTASDSVVYSGGNSGMSELNDVKEFNHSFHTFKFKFAAPFFDNEEKTLYSFRLEEFENDWSPWSTQTEKEYTNLSEGDYTFKVRARNIYDVESDIGIYSFTILPPYYRTWWAYSLYVIAVLLLISIIVKVYTRRLRAQRTFLENVIKERTAEIHSQNIQLQNLNATKDKFFSILGHDLKSPIHSLVGFAELLMKYGSSLTKEEIEKASKDIHKSVKNLFSLIDNLLEWSLSQTGAIDFTPNVFNLSEVLQENCELLEGQALLKKIKIINQVKEPCLLNANENSVSTVFRNLISNAIKFTPYEGSITLAASATEKEIIISIQDTGVGISEKMREKLFRIDTKHSTKGTDNEKGTGLGLILCREFVEKNNGRIWVESEQGKGSVFYVALPKG
jgi:signal transduction histidine kinase/ligand-binding sensor domain-containing protein